MKYESSILTIFVHLIGEIEEVVFAIENAKPEISQPKLTEAVVLLSYIGQKCFTNIE